MRTPPTYTHNWKDVHVLSGRIDTKNATCSAEIAGIVKKIGHAVTAFSPGDRVVVMAPGHFGNVERVPEWACCKLRDKEDYTVCSFYPDRYDFLKAYNCSLDYGNNPWRICNRAVCLEPPCTA